MTVSANDIKTRGMAAIEDAFDSDATCLLTKRGKPVYAVIDLNDYDEFREWQLDKAVKEAEEDIAAGNFTVVTDIDAHVKGLLND